MNLLSFIDIWSNRIPNELKIDELDWTLVFEDDVNFIKPSKVSLRTYIQALEEFMNNPQVQLEER